VSKSEGFTARTVLVTGGSRGLGFAIAERFVADGHRVAVTSRSGGGPAGALDLAADVTDAGELAAAHDSVRESLGPIEVLVANAGITRDRSFGRMSEEDFTRVIDTNLTGAFRSCRLVIGDMVQGGFGRVVLISSVGGFIGSVGQVNYASSKAGLLGMARGLAQEFGTRGITANVVAPGPFATDMLASVTPERLEEIRRLVPLGRFGRDNEIAGTVAWLAGPDGGFVTGALIPVDGGAIMGH
jgi:3-oxoacyl-[acyl-carrier protein] reductase